MKIKPYFTASLFIALGLFILELWKYWDNPSDIYHIPIIFMFLFGVVVSLFQIRESHDKNLIILVGAGILALMWIFSYAQVPTTNTTFYLVLGGFTLVSVIGIILAIRGVEKNKKKLEYYDDILFGNPDDIVTLNNKGVELARQNKKRKAVECFNQVLDMNPEDPAALYNKGTLMREIDYFESKEYLEKAENLDPGLEKAMVAGKELLGDRKIKGKYMPKNSV